MGISYGVFLMAFFSLMWGSWGVAALNGLGGWLLWLVVDFIFLVLLTGGIFLIASSRHLRRATLEQSKAWSRRGRWFGIIFGAEGVLIGIAVSICYVANHTDVIAPAIALVVGLHFIPLARVFRRKLDYWTGTITCLVALVGMFFVPNTLVVGNYDIEGKPAFVGLFTALILWFIGGYILLYGIKALKPTKR